MSREDQRIAACEGKQPLSQRRAVEVAKTMKRKGRRGVEEYKCKFCGCWHVGRSAINA